LTRILRNLPGFKSGRWSKALIAVPVYFFLLIVTLALTIPSVPTLVLDQIKPTNKDTVLINGKTSSGKPVYLLEKNEIVQSVKADLKGEFFFKVNDLQDGNFAYTIEACNNQKRKHCQRKNLLVTIDQTPPVQPVITLPKELPEKSDGKILISGNTEPKAKIIAQVKDKKSLEIRTNESGGFEIEIGLVPGNNQIEIRTADEAGNESRPIISEINFNPRRLKAKAIRVIDGDTIELETGQRVRYIGIDTPETVHPSKPVQCYGQEASAKNKELVEGKEIYLEKDVSETDKFGRLLRYIWLGDLLINEYLVREGYAFSTTYSPDVKYQHLFLEAERKARQEEKGLWGSACKNWIPG